jgi:hypothetical protein
VSLPVDTITDAQIRELRDRYGEGTRVWDPVVVHECDLALGDVTALNDSDRDQRALQARERCATILNTRGGATRKESP